MEQQSFFGQESAPLAARMRPQTLDELLEANLQPMIERIRKDGTNAGENSNGEL